MNNRYSIFISSTYSDLIEERRALMNLLDKKGSSYYALEKEPVSNDSIPDRVYSCIDQCDSFILIVGGRYGYISDNHKSFVENEYEYAFSHRKKIYAFLKKIDEKEMDPRQVVFREKVKQNTFISEYSTPQELCAQVMKYVLDVSEVTNQIEDAATDGIKETVEGLEKIEISINQLCGKEVVTETINAAEFLGLSSNNSDKSNQEILIEIANSLQDEKELLKAILKAQSERVSGENLASRTLWDFIVPIIVGVIIAVIIKLAL